MSSINFSIFPPIPSPAFHQNLSLIIINVWEWKWHHAIIILFTAPDINILTTVYKGLGIIKGFAIVFLSSTCFVLFCFSHCFSFYVSTGQEKIFLIKYLDFLRDVVSVDAFFLPILPLFFRGACQRILKLVLLFLIYF